MEGVTSRAANEKAMIKKCLWKGVKINCAALFRTFPSDRGMCCTFNMEAAEDLFRQSQYTAMVQTMQERDLDKAFGDHQPPQAYRDNHEPKTAVGKNKGKCYYLKGSTTTKCQTGLWPFFEKQV